MKNLGVNYEYVVLKHTINLNYALGCFCTAVAFPQCIVLSFLSAKLLIAVELGFLELLFLFLLYIGSWTI